MFRFTDIHERERLEVERLYSEDSQTNKEECVSPLEVDKILELANSTVFGQNLCNRKQGWQALFFFL